MKKIIKCPKGHTETCYVDFENKDDEYIYCGICGKRYYLKDMKIKEIYYEK